MNGSMKEGITKRTNEKMMTDIQKSATTTERRQRSLSPPPLFNKLPASLPACVGAGSGAAGKTSVSKRERDRQQDRQTDRRPSIRRGVAEPIKRFARATTHMEDRCMER
mmetsp:Transcript_27353/g.68276  ORF Transcript_27353/g.68276 Transcript_27353/m.68276 type:complete len:109 (-) Transcript_27353:653-979(-)